MTTIRKRMQPKADRARFRGIEAGLWRKFGRPHTGGSFIGVGLPGVQAGSLITFKLDGTRKMSMVSVDGVYSLEYARGGSQ